MARVTGIGGIFFKATNPKVLTAWYVEHLGLPEHPYKGVVFSNEDPGVTTWSPFPADTPYFGPGPQTGMVNFRVDDLDALLAQLARDGVTIDPERAEYSFGRFAWIVDPEGNRVELWEPAAPKPVE